MEEHENHPKLRREAILVSRDRGRLAVLFAMCTMAGVAMGFGLRGVGAACPTEANTPPRLVATPGCDQGCTWLGIQMLDTPDGVQVARIFEGTPAADLARDGLLAPGDTIHSIGGRRVTQARHVVRQIRRRAPGDRVQMRLRRDRAEAVVLLEAELGWISGQRFRSLR